MGGLGIKLAKEEGSSNHVHSASIWAPFISQAAFPCLCFSCLQLTVNVKYFEISVFMLLQSYVGMLKASESCLALTAWGFLIQKDWASPWHLILTCSLYLCTVIFHLFCLWVEINCKKLKNPSTFKTQTLLNFWHHDIPSEVLTVTSVSCSSQNNSAITCLPQSWSPLLISWSIWNLSHYGRFLGPIWF